MTVKVITDSTSDLPQELADELDITIVPLNVIFGSEVYRDNVDITADEFYDRLVNDETFPKTSQPSPGDFVQTYDRFGENSDGILSIHISASESGTYNSASQATRETNAKCPIEIVDSKQFSMGLGMVVIAAARAAKEGASLSETKDVANAAIERAKCIAVFDTLEYLERGGRMGKATSMLGSLLKIKPMMIVRNGQAHPLAKPRTISKAVSKLKQVAKEFGTVESVCVMYSTTEELAQSVQDDLRKLLPQTTEHFMARFGPVIGTYAGPGAVGMALLLSEDSSDPLQ